MVKSKGKEPDWNVPRITATPHTDFNGTTDTSVPFTHDLVNVNEGTGMDVVDGEMVRLSARQMSVENDAACSEEYSTWYADDTNNCDSITSFHDRGDLCKIVIPEEEEEINEESVQDKQQGEYDKETVYSEQQQKCDKETVHDEQQEETAKNKQVSKDDNDFNPNSLSSGDVNSLSNGDVIKKETSQQLSRVFISSDNVKNTKIENKSISGSDGNFDVVDGPVPPDKRMEKVCFDSEWLPTFTILDLMLALLGVSFFVFDIFSDYRLAIIYYLSNQMDRFYLTLFFIIVPAVVSAVISLVWSYMDYKDINKQKVNCEEVALDPSTKSDRKTTSGEMVLLILKVIFSVFQLGRCFRSIVYMYYVIKSWQAPYRTKTREFKKKALEQKNDSAILGLIDGFLESALQLLLQLYLSISGQIYMDFLRIGTICLSWVSAALLHTSYYRNNRKIQKDKRNVGYVGALFYFLWRMCELGPRFFLIVLVAYTVHFWIAIPLVVHFIFMLVFYVVQKPKLRGICCSEKSGYPFLILISYIGIFCYVNLQKDKTRRFSAIYYTVFYLENIVMFIIVLMLFPSTNPYFDTWKNCSYILFPGLVCHLIFQTLYYKYFHPNNHKSEGSGEKNCCERLRARCKAKTVWGIHLL